jgi:hypothetical protein
MTPSRIIATLMLPLAIGVGGASLAPADEKPALRMRAFAVNMDAGTRVRSGMLDIVVERWSTDADVARLEAVLREKGSDELLSALQDIEPRAGYIRSPGRLGWDVHFAREEALPGGGRRIIVATDRPMSFWELWNRPRSADYEFTVAEIRLGPDGKGEGELVPAAKITWNQDRHTFEVENFSYSPVRLTDVRVEGADKAARN